MEPISPGWRLVAMTVEGEAVRIHGVELLKHQHEWKDCSEAIVVSHPDYPCQRHKMFVYCLVVNGKTVKFAGGEFSNGVYGFYEPERA